jgi:hypothetical protein
MRPRGHLLIIRLHGTWPACDAESQSDNRFRVADNPRSDLIQHCEWYDDLTPAYACPGRVSHTSKGGWCAAPGERLHEA